MLNVVLAPFVAELSSSQQTKRLERVLRGAATLVGLPSLVALLLMLLIPGLVIDWTYGESFRGAALPLSILAFGQFVFVASGANAMTLTMTGHQRVLMASSMLTLTIYCLVAPWAISQGGIVGGAAVGSILLATQNILVTILVKSRIGIWTTVSTSPAAVKDAWRGIVRSRRRANR
jgi:O-antigen/teichoic acid export membrane protein